MYCGIFPNSICLFFFNHNQYIAMDIQKRITFSLGVRTDYPCLIDAFYINSNGQVGSIPAWKNFLSSCEIEQWRIDRDIVSDEKVESWAPGLLFLWGNQMSAFCLLAEEDNLLVAVEIVGPTDDEEGSLRVKFFEQKKATDVTDKKIFSFTFCCGNYYRWRLWGRNDKDIHVSFERKMYGIYDFNKDFDFIKEHLPEIKTAL